MKKGKTAFWYYLGSSEGWGKKESKGPDDKKLGEKQETKAQWHWLIGQNESKKDQQTHFDKWHLETENMSEKESFLICKLSAKSN